MAQLVSLLKLYNAIRYPVLFARSCILFNIYLILCSICLYIWELLLSLCFWEPNCEKYHAKRIVACITLVVSSSQQINFFPFQAGDTLSVYLEYISGGSIHKLLQEYGPFKEPVIQNYTRQILCGLAYLHSRTTVHRYVKVWIASSA